MSGVSVALVAVAVIGVVLVPGLVFVWPARREPACRTDLGVALLTGALVAFTVLAVQIVFDLRFSSLERQRQAAEANRDAKLAMRLAISSQQNLTGIQLQDAELADFYLAGKTLNEAQLMGATLEGAVLARAKLRAADLTGANLNGADLRRVDLFGARLDGATLVEAVMTSADLRDAKLTGARLTAVDLSNAHLEGADLTGASISVDELAGAFYDEYTIWPQRVRVKPCKRGAICLIA